MSPKPRLLVDASATVEGRPLVLEPVYFPTLVGAYMKALRDAAEVVVMTPKVWHDALRSRLDEEGVVDVHLVESADPSAADVVLDLRNVYHPPLLKRSMAKVSPGLPDSVWVVKTEEDISRAAATLERHDMYVVARILVIPVARRLAHLLLPGRISPNAVTAASAAFGIAAAGMMLLPDWPWRVAAAAAIHVSVTLDFTDGYLARLRGTDSKRGYWFDTVMDEVVKFGLFLGMTLLAARDGPPWAGAVGVLVLLLYHVLTCSHWLTQSLEQNDPSKVAKSTPRRRPGFVGVLQRAHNRLGDLDVHLYIVAGAVLLGLEAWALLLFGLTYSYRFVRMLQVRLTAA